MHYFPSFDHAIFIVFTYFASFTGCEEDIFEVIYNLYGQGSKFGGNLDKFGGKSLRKLNSAEFMEFVFSKSEQSPAGLPCEIEFIKNYKISDEDQVSSICNRFTKY